MRYTRPLSGFSQWGYRLTLSLVFGSYLQFVNAAEQPVSTEQQAPSGAVKKVSWDGEGELGYVQTTGNTRTKSVVLKFKIVNERPKWTHRLTGDAYRATDQDTITAENYRTEWRSMYDLRKVDHLFGLLRYADDRFSGYDRRTTEILGYGYHLFNLDVFKWEVEAGVGGRQTRFTTGEQLDEAIYRLGTDLTWKISETSSLSQDLFTEQGDENRYSESTTQLSVKINSHLALRVAFNARHNSDVPAGSENLDTRSTVTLVVDF